MREEALQQEIGELRAQVNELEAWASGIHMALVEVLPFLLRGHPEAVKVQHLLQASDRRYEELLAHPERAEDSDEKATLYESRKMLHRQLGLLGAWPGVDPNELAGKLLAPYLDGRVPPSKRARR